MKTLVITLLALIFSVSAYAMPPPRERPDTPICDITEAIRIASLEAKKIDPSYYCASAQYIVAYTASKENDVGCPHWRVLFYIPKDQIKGQKFKDLLVLVSADGKTVKVFKNPEEVMYRV